MLGSMPTTLSMLFPFVILAMAQVPVTWVVNSFLISLAVSLVVLVIVSYLSALSAVVLPIAWTGTGKSTEDIEAAACASLPGCTSTAAW